MPRRSFPLCARHVSAQSWITLEMRVFSLLWKMTTETDPQSNDQRHLLSMVRRYLYHSCLVFAVFSRVLHAVRPSTIQADSLVLCSVRHGKFGGRTSTSARGLSGPRARRGLGAIHASLRVATSSNSASLGSKSGETLLRIERDCVFRSRRPFSVARVVGGHGNAPLSREPRV